NFPVACTIFGAAGEVRYADMQTIAVLNAGDTVQVSFASFTPTIIETCQVVFRTLLLNDSNPDNDRRARQTFITNSIEIVIGTGTSGSSIYCIYAYRAYTVSNAIYLQSEIGYYGYITNLAYYKTSGTNTTQIDDVKIYMRRTDQSTVATGAYDTTGFTRVYSGSFPIYAIGWMGVEVNPPFLYNNQDNLEILILKGPPAMTSGYPSWQYTTQSPNYRNRYQYSDAGWPTSLTQTYYRPNIRFYLTPTAPGVEELPFEFPCITILNAAKPNPLSRGVTNISFSIGAPTNAALKIYDASGRLIKTLVNAPLEQGMHNYIWNGRDENNRKVAEGIYFYTLKTDDYSQTKKLVLTR
ncbi:MAG: T9SS type A sorting domain-containing protein, partial [Candidatus Latescibacteria bacterium]|nr:T9SS type A sorting domain-containing protein [Candidatus Latescibacterota bacterium]